MLVNLRKISSTNIFDTQKPFEMKFCEQVRNMNEKLQNIFNANDKLVEISTFFRKYFLFGYLSFQFERETSTKKDIRLWINFLSS